MNRRSFILSLAALPIVGRFVKAEPKPASSGTYSVKITYRRPSTGETIPKPDAVRIYGSDAYIYSSTGPWFLTK